MNCVHFKPRELYHVPMYGNMHNVKQQHVTGLEDRVELHISIKLKSRVKTITKLRTNIGTVAATVSVVAAIHFNHPFL